MRQIKNERIMLLSMICCSTGRRRRTRGPSVTWSLNILMVLALLYGSLVIIQDELERRSHQSTTVYCGIGERWTLCTL